MRADLFDVVRYADAAGYEAALQEWKTLHPSLVVQYVFDAGDDLLARGRDARAEFEKYCGRYGMDPSDFGRSFVRTGGTYQITGWDRKATRYKVVLRDPRDGREYAMSPNMVLQLLGRSPSTSRPKTPDDEGG